ncbi:MAG: Imm3 family immunity protein [Anaerofustis sp.]
MEDFEFNELVGYIQEDFQEFSTSMLKKGQNYLNILSRFYVEYDNVMNAGICENTIISATLCMELERVGQKSISKGQYQQFMDAFNAYSPSKVAGEISPGEVEELTQMVAKALDILKYMRIV